MWTASTRENREAGGGEDTGKRWGEVVWGGGGWKRSEFKKTIKVVNLLDTSERALSSPFTNVRDSYIVGEMKTGRTQI